MQDYKSINAKHILESLSGFLGANRKIHDVDLYVDIRM